MLKKKKNRNEYIRLQKITHKTIHKKDKQHKSSTEPVVPI